jgi:hypothetical protein
MVQSGMESAVMLRQAIVAGISCVTMGFGSFIIVRKVKDAILKL